MAKITRVSPSAGSTSNLKPMGEGGASAASGGVQLGGIVGSMGAATMQAGQQYFQAAARSIEEAQVTNKTADASKALNEAYASRIQQRTDEDGNPTFETLGDDVNKMGEDIHAEAVKGIFNPAVRAKFSAMFNKQLEGKQVLALGEARKQHIDYSRATMSKGIESNIENALTGDPALTSQYLDDAESSIEGALQGGIISHQEAQHLKDTTKGSIMTGAMQRVIESNPDRALEELSHGPEANGLDSKQHKALTRQANGAKSDIEKAAAKAEREQAKIVSDTQKLNTSKIELRIIQDDEGIESDIEKAFTNGDITEEQRISSLIKYERAKKKQTKKETKLDRMDEAMVDGDLSEFTSGDINKHFIETTDLAEKAKGESLTLSEEALAGADYNAPVGILTKKVQQSLKFGKVEDAEEAIKSWEMLHEKNPVVLSKMDKQSVAIVTMASELQSSSNMSGADAVNKAREAVLNKSDEDRKKLGKDYSKESAFKAGQMNETISELLGLDAFDFFSTKDVEPATVTRMNTLLKEAYIETGDADMAIAMVQKQTKGLYGVTNANGEDADSDIIFLPPESRFQAELHGQLRPNLEAQMSDSIPEGYTAKDLRIESDIFTKQNNTWSVYVTDELGIDRILLDEDGSPVRWAPTAKELSGRKNIEAEKQVTIEIEKAAQLKNLLKTSSSVGLRSGFGHANFNSGKDE